MKLIEQENAALYAFAEQHSGPLIIIANHISPNFLALLDIFKNYRKDPTLIYTNIPNIEKILNATLPDGHPSIFGHQLYAKDIYELLKMKNMICTSKQ